jgi:hypothetical protein
MTPLLIAALGLLMVATAFLSGLFGMAGGLILIGVLLAQLGRVILTSGMSADFPAGFHSPFRTHSPAMKTAF